jgi:predicted LPLAT superfamily acyltransferase
VRALFYRSVAAFARLVGLWLPALLSWLISTGYFFLSPSRLATSLRFFRALFPDRSSLHALRCAWRQYHSFAQVFTDRLRLAAGGIDLESEGWEHLEAAAARGTGGLILMSHLGFWEVAARLFRRKGLRILLYMEAKQKEQIERLQKRDAALDGVRIVSATDDGASLAGIDGLRFLSEGGFVSIAGDRGGAQPSQRVEVSFLGHTVHLPKAPYVLALVRRAPLFVFFALRTGRARYRIVALPPVVVTPSSRADREAAIQRAAQAYADRLAEFARSHPEQWYTFAPFLERPEPR